jgi:hypothetical protein
MDNRFPLHRCLVAALLFLAAACAPLIAPYSLQAYTNATSLKAETLALISESNEPFAQHQADVRALKVKLSAAQEFSAGMPMNRLSTLQWSLLNNPDTGVVGRFFTSWEKQGTMGAAYIEAKRDQAGRAFDSIICLEANKEKDVDCLNSAAAPAAPTPTP